MISHKFNFIFLDCRDFALQNLAMTVLWADCYESQSLTMTVLRVNCHESCNLQSLVMTHYRRILDCFV